MWIYQLNFTCEGTLLILASQSTSRWWNNSLNIHTLGLGLPSSNEAHSTARAYRIVSAWASSKYSLSVFLAQLKMYKSRQRLDFDLVENSTRLLRTRKNITTLIGYKGYKDEFIGEILKKDYFLLHFHFILCYSV
jgi:hypothetical protein